MAATPVPSKGTARLGCPARPTISPFKGGRIQFRKRVLNTSFCLSAEDECKGGGGNLGEVFNQFVFLKGIKSPAAAGQRLNPSPLLPPTAVLEQAMSMLQRNDWPEPDSGVLAAFNLTLPAKDGHESRTVRSWQAAEEWLSWERFHALLHVSYNPLINCDSWRMVSPLVFPSERFDNKAIQAVEVRARPRQGRTLAPAGTHAASPDVTTALRSYTYTFCWERVESGSFKDCWLISGVRVGNYAL
ncbi:hypothetical protein Vafri_20107 [Volvox africanus]|uniref:Uncharacterized protein n=1 Tax=Volvox africanus TaxID=51714 RepID=A0A8J4BPH9_9CHLO|nr:hypothetical protein Vafri_20107 [Volvox africanus]